MTPTPGQKWVLATAMVAVLSLTAYLATAEVVSLDGAISHQSTTTHSGPVVHSEGRSWGELSNMYLNCLGSPVISTDVSIMFDAGSGPARIRVVVQPFVEGDRPDPIVLDPGAMVFRPGGGASRASSSFVFSGVVTQGASVASLSVQMRRTSPRDVAISKASSRTLWQATC